MEEFLTGRVNYSVLQWKKERNYVGPFLDGGFPFLDHEFNFGEDVKLEIDLQLPLKRGPLVEADIGGCFDAILIDCIALEDPEDAWEIKSSLDTLRESLIVEKRGQLVWELFQTEKNYIQQLMVIENINRMAELYTEFIGNYSKALTCIRELESANPEYVKFMTASSRSKDTNRQSLKDSLVYPVQRTTRYHLFLAGSTLLIVDLLKHTSNEHPDYFNLQVALQTVLDFVDSINHNKKMEEERAKLARILSRTINCPNGFMDAAPSLVCISDALCAVTRKSLILILFTDSLVILMHEKKNKRFTALLADQPYTFVRKLLLEETNITHSEKLLTFTKSIAPKIEKTLSTPSITIVKSQSSTDLRSLGSEPGKISRANSDRASMRISRGGPTRSRKAKLMQILGSDPYKAPTEEAIQPEVLDFLIAAEGWYPPEAVVPVLGGGSLAEGVADLGADSFVVLFHEGLNEFVDSYEKAQTKCRLSAKVQE
ncbi:hypothetical protein HK103_005697 [Boothiomyces macroporosus]|uniref:DH domain-containing protein n=1 Tax=Boothiomyces macroporosus TaxID=261099 RepID=A0AAD5UIZ3_9FUNG|nr:hypothetical protein HK103_005697 [Boothiomyces macroporosus]